MNKHLMALAAMAGLFAPMAETAPVAAGTGSPTPAPTPKPEKAKASKPKKAAAKAKPKAKKGKGGTKGVTGPAVLRQYAPGYHKDKEKKTAGGNVSVDSNDDLAKKLRGMELDKVYEQAAKILEDEDGGKETVASLKKRYGKLNVGMQRMNLGNRMRAVLNAK